MMNDEIGFLDITIEEDSGMILCECGAVTFFNWKLEEWSPRMKDESERKIEVDLLNGPSCNHHNFNEDAEYFITSYLNKKSERNAEDPRNEP